MAWWTRIASTPGAVRIVGGLGSLYLAIALLQLTAGTIVERIVDFVLFALAGLALVYGAHWLGRSDVSDDVLPRALVWCLGGFAIMLGVALTVVFSPTIDVDEPLWALGIATAVGAIGGLGIGLNEVRALTRAREIERRNHELRRYETLFEESTDVNAVLDVEGRFQYLTPSVRHVLGYEPDDLVGEIAFEYMHPADREATMAGFAQAIEHGRSQEPVEFRFEHADGSWVVLEGRGRNLMDDPEIEGVVAYTHDVTQRQRLEDDLRRERDLRQRIVETSPIGILVIDSHATVTFLNDRGEQLLGRTRSELNELDDPDSLFDADEADDESDGDGTPLAQVMADNEPVFDLDVQLSRPDGTTVWLSLNAAPIPDADDDASRIVFAFEDVTDRKRNHQRLVLLNELSRNLAEAATGEAVADLAVETAREVLPLPFVTIAFYDEATGRLQQAAGTEALSEQVGDGDFFGDDTDLTWQAFVDQSEIISADLADGSAVQASETPLRSTMVFPLGDHGVFLAAGTTAGAFSDTDVSLASMLVANTRSSLDRVARERTLRDRKDTLEEQNAILQRLQRINDTIRGITTELIRASTREEVVQAVCEKLTSAEAYSFAWIGTRDAVTGEVTPEAWAGTDDGYLDAVTVATREDDDGREPTAIASRTGETTVRNHLSADPPFEPWRQAALERGYQSAITVPLKYQDTTYGVLSLYATRADVFDTVERAVLTELGETIGYALNALDRKRALVSEESVELEFELRKGTSALFQFAAEHDCGFEFENVVPRPDGRPGIYFTISGVPTEDVIAFGEQSAEIEELTVVSESEDEVLFECRLRDSSFFSALLDRGATPRSITATGEEANAVIRIPRRSSVRTFVELFSTQYEECELVGRREVDEPVKTKGEFRAEVNTRLTERQREILQTAYVAGFFDWPREITAQDLAESIGVSQPTVSRHIRTGERELFGLLFDE